jgi:hypothetical protein
MYRKGNVEQAIRMPLGRLADPPRLRGGIIASVVAIRGHEPPVPARREGKDRPVQPISPSPLIRPQPGGFERSALALGDAVQ